VVKSGEGGTILQKMKLEELMRTTKEKSVVNGIILKKE
jgi:hypothetical protein